MSLSRVQYQQIIDSLDNLNWNKVEAAVSSPESSPEFPIPRSRPKRVGERELLLKLKFQLPRFSMELLDHSLRAIVSLSFEDFEVRNCSTDIVVKESIFKTQLWKRMEFQNCSKLFKTVS